MKTKMAPLENLQPEPTSIIEQPSSLHKSFLSDFFDERDFISICPNPMWAPPGTGDEPNYEHDMIEFEFLSGSRPTILKPARPDPKPDYVTEGPDRKPRAVNGHAIGNTKWLLPDEDPSPRQPKCTVLWKELLNLKKSHATSASVFSISSSSSSSSSSTFFGASSGGVINKDKCKARRMGIRIRPVLKVPICSQARSTAVFSPIFPARKGRIEG